MATSEREPHDSTAAEIERTADPWKGPFRERDRYGYLTGHAYVVCRDCGIEVTTGGKDNATHRDGCRFGDR